ncbi:hypothetical protein QBC39DRAFT_180908 [Podospora conica]|nr:hypothetical protein QBC39DRAFT_180908 [Schizothecium conicum]
MGSPWLSVSSPGSHTKRWGFESPRLCLSSGVCFFECKRLRGESADTMCRSDPGTHPTTTSLAAMPISSSHFPPFDCADAAHMETHHIPGPVISALRPTPFRNPNPATNTVRPPSPLCTERPVRRAPQHHTRSPAPHQTGGSSSSWGNTRLRDRETPANEPHTTNGDDWMRDTSHFPLLSPARRRSLNGRLAAPDLRYLSLVIHSRAILVCVSLLTWCTLQDRDSVSVWLPRPVLMRRSDRRCRAEGKLIATTLVLRVGCL